MLGWGGGGLSNLLGGFRRLVHNSLFIIQGMGRASSRMGGGPDFLIQRRPWSEKSSKRDRARRKRRGLSNFHVTGKPRFQGGKRKTLYGGGAEQSFTEGTKHPCREGKKKGKAIFSSEKQRFLQSARNLKSRRGKEKTTTYCENKER